MITKRQIEALEDLRDGLSCEESAIKRGVMRCTVAQRRRGLYAGIGARNGANAVWIAIKLGILGLIGPVEAVMVVTEKNE